MSKKREFSLSARLYLLVAGLLLCGGVISLMTLGGMADSNEGLRRVYIDRVEPLQDLKLIADTYAVNIVDAAHKARAGALTPEAALLVVNQGLETIDKTWVAYLATELVDEEKQLVARARDLMGGANQATNQLREILGRKDMVALERFASQDLYPAIDPVSEVFGKLVDLQVSVARGEYESATADYEAHRFEALMALAAALALGMLVAWRMISGIAQRLGGEPTAVRDIASRIAGGDFEFDVPVRARDQQSAMVALRAMKESLHNLKLNAEGQINAIHRSQMVLEMGLDGVITAVNPAFAQAFGSTVDALVGKPHDTLVWGQGKERGVPQFAWESLRAGGYDSGEFQYQHKEGRVLWLQAAVSAILDSNGKPFKIVLFATDITQRKQEARMNAAFKGALDNVGTCLMVTDLEMNIIYLNESARRLMSESETAFRKELPAFNASRLLGANMDTFHRSPEHQRRLISHLQQAATAQIQLGGRTIRLTANPMLIEGGERLGTVLEWRDLTQEVAIESEVQTIVQQAVQGNLGSRISLAGKTGFFEKLSSGINDLVSNVDVVVREVQDMVAAANRGDLTRRVDTRGKGGLLTQIATPINQLTDNMAGVVRDVSRAAAQINTGAAEISQGNGSLAQRTEEQASSLEETASSMEEMTSTVKQNADNAGQASQLAVAARDHAEKGGAVVADAVRAMANINDASKRIADIIGVIDEIAFQTNLLALNAAVEAARAGEQGRGFAVVASEVRNLAGRSATAAKEIKALIQDSVKKVDEGSTLVTQSGATLTQIVSAVKKVTDIVAEIAAASNEQSAGIEQVNKAVMQLDELTQQNAALVEQVSAASQSMAEQAGRLDASMQRYRVGESSASGADAGGQALAA